MPAVITGIDDDLSVVPGYYGEPGDKTDGAVDAATRS